MTLLHIFIKRQLTFLRHIIRKEGFEYVILTRHTELEGNKGHPAFEN